MYRITKVLNHNTILAVRVEDNQECMIMGKGVGFGKKISERIEVREEDTVYFLKEPTERGNARDIIKSVSPDCLEIANEVLNEAEKIFGKIDRSILFPMADHIAYAVQRSLVAQQSTSEIFFFPPRPWQIVFDSSSSA